MWDDREDNTNNSANYADQQFSLILTTKRVNLGCDS